MEAIPKTGVNPKKLEQDRQIAEFRAMSRIVQKGSGGMRRFSVVEYQIAQTLARLPDLIQERVCNTL